MKNMIGLRSVLLLSSLFGSCIGYPSALGNRASVIPPIADPFYVPPQGYEDTAPGTILRHRKVPHPIAAIEPVVLNLAGSYQVLYRSSDNFGNPTATITTVLVPENADPSKLLSYQIPEDSAFSNCAPSHVLQIGTTSSDILSALGYQTHTILFEAALKKGWIVSLPDFEGPHAAFLANRRAGHAVLDGIRAVLNTTDFTGISPYASVSMWGYSGGSLATGFAAELQQSYAPDLDMIVGAVLGGVIGDIETVTYTVNNGPFVGLNFGGFHGIANEYPNIATLIQEQLVDDATKRAKFEDANHNCFIANLLEYAFEDCFSYFKDRNILGYPQFQQAFKDNNLGSRTPSMPIFAYKGYLDEVSPSSGTETIVSKYCASGATVNYKDVLTHEHILLQLDGFLEPIAWLEKRMNGEPMQPGCQRTNELLPLAESGSLDTLVLTVEGEVDNILHV
ncbi:secretory lipase-domain-containing protein [Penicillium riverlandense]|uniref:secretory lipase-domain-containing protein n=1 Tax=Penicillium riverlandense TaxID=1903569 RepID=UPI002546E76C|nr:secretory lipase-domain-containing protein [Penicillium riverlandense]KAJ5832523.1 secretory lipase-domain-containing protein [Penicillium riverlandense]